MTARLESLSESNRSLAKQLQERKDLTEIERKIFEFNRVALATKTDLDQLIQKISRNGTTNLLIGLLLTIIAIIILLISVFSSAPAVKVGQANPYAEYLLHMLPRLSVVVFVELFSLLFLEVV